LQEYVGPIPFTIVPILQTQSSRLGTVFTDSFCSTKYTV